MLEPDELLAGFEEAFLTSGRPKGLTLVHALGIGDRVRKGTNRFAHPGMVKRVIGGHWTWSPTMLDMARNGDIEAYCLPSGAIVHLLREIGAGRARPDHQGRSRHVRRPAQWRRALQTHAALTMWSS